MEKDRRQLQTYTTDDMVHALTLAKVGNASDQHQHLYREALRALVRLAKAEKLLEIKRDSARAMGFKPE